MKSITYFFFYLYVAALLLVGASGVLIAPWELARVFHVPLSAMPARAMATLVNQYRFLKGMEFACGCFGWWWRREIFSDPRYLRLFLVIVWAGIAGRLLAVLLNGMPTALFMAFLLIEAFTGVLMFWTYTRVKYGYR
ncbi:MAG TPA: DUF4345 family protein [Terriglobales bacterium]|nr:DUF4345 family protein [Terriglobales bacterium]